jgi:hypothetical protein
MATVVENKTYSIELSHEEAVHLLNTLGRLTDSCHYSDVENDAVTKLHSNLKEFITYEERGPAMHFSPEIGE